MNKSLTTVHHLTSFRVTEKSEKATTRTVAAGEMTTGGPRNCPACGGIMHIHQKQHILLQRIPIHDDCSWCKRFKSFGYNLLFILQLPDL